MPPVQAAGAARILADPSRRGFTLVELVIVLAMASVLAGLAIPSYRAQLAKGRRADGQQALRVVAQRLERYHGEVGTYAGAKLGAGGLYPAASAAGHYTLAVARQTADGFTITATPRGGQAGDACATLVYDQWGETSVGPDASLPANQCW